MADIIEHLRLALEIFKAGGRAELGFHSVHEERDSAALALVPVVVGPGVADRPAVGLRNKRLEALEGGHAGYAEFDTEAAVDAEVAFRRFPQIGTGAAQVHLVGAGS